MTINTITLINLTPHAIVLRAADGTDTTVEPSGTIARVSSTTGTPSDVAGIPVPVWSADSMGEVTGLPDPSFSVLLIVSGMVGDACKGRRFDVLVPGTGPNDGAIRNEKGHIVAVTRLKRI